jgi:hypothetical protein
MFRCLLHHLQGDHCSTCSTTVYFVQYCYAGCVTICAIHPVFFNLPYWYIVENNMCFVLLYLKILTCNTLLSLGLFCMLAICVFTVFSCVCVRNGVENLRGPLSSCYVRPLSWCAPHNIPLLIILLRQLSSIQNLIFRFCDLFSTYRTSLLSKKYKFVLWLNMYSRNFITA